MLKILRTSLYTITSLAVLLVLAVLYFKKNTTTVGRVKITPDKSSFVFERSYNPIEFQFIAYDSNDLIMDISKININATSSNSDCISTVAQQRVMVEKRSEDVPFDCIVTIDVGGVKKEISFKYSVD